MYSEELLKKFISTLESVVEFEDGNEITWMDKSKGFCFSSKIRDDSTYMTLSVYEDRMDVGFLTIWKRYGQGLLEDRRIVFNSTVNLKDIPTIINTITNEEL